MMSPRVDQVVEFICLHEDSAEELESRSSGESPVFRVHGKYRPCLIIAGPVSGYFRVWLLTRNSSNTRLDGLRRCDGKQTPSFLRDPKYPNEIRWIHSCLARKLIGKLEHWASQEIHIRLEQLDGRRPPG